MSSTTIRLNLAGRRFGRLVAQEYVRRPAGPNAWLCRCDCGAEVEIIVQSLTTGNTRSCGCLHRDDMSARFRKHGAKSSSEYEIWCGMIKRCENPASEAWKDYGGRGIRVCERWRVSFQAFIDDVGPRPSKHHSIDRHPNNDGNYDPGNVRWATMRQQAQNTRRNRTITHDGETLCLSEWARRLGISESSLRGRLAAGWSEVDAVTKGKQCA